MKKCISLVLSITLILGLLSGCKGKEEEITDTLNDNITYKLGLNEYSLSYNFQIGNKIYDLEGEHKENVTYGSLMKNNIPYTDIFIENSRVLLKNTDAVVKDLEKDYGELEKSSTKYIEIPFSHDNAGLGNLDSHVLIKYMNLAFANAISEYAAVHEGSIVFENGINVITLVGEDAQSVIDSFISYLNDKEFEIYKEIIASKRGDELAEYETARAKALERFEKFVNKLEKALDLDTDDLEIEYKNLLSDDEFQELLLITSGSTRYRINGTIVKENGLEVSVPTNCINIDNLKPLSKEEQKLKFEETYSRRYPELSEMRSVFEKLGYSDTEYAATTNGVGVYGIREPKSNNFGYSVKDEIFVEYRNSWLAEASMIGLFTRVDFELYKMELFAKYITEMETIIGTDFLVEMEPELGYYENVISKWEFYVDIAEVEVDDGEGMIKVELTSKQH